ncbi:FAD-binding domain-containing protein [Hasllibacter sp. MH4015]|uniref:FAD-binding domain-containing protein n=1 Tax=Hasllibacter sp. MH4015 TaxID=2854029 RepID=UPI001CD520C9|nr:FAD-binding domain-containing protein [Hasllibacter sp. MH4015]
MTQLSPTRQAALSRLSAFVPHAGRDYASLRNYDRPDQGHPHVSQLSPYLRHRLITEPEVLRAVLDHHSADAAEKFIQEVCWRTYWKGWLELRPQVWAEYRRDLEALGKVDGMDRAEAGKTDIAAFNAWAQELVETGYLHNHARMWFASIWIFTLGLPWQSGADFFMRHLLDGDPASNTLSWRWVAGLQTQGKHYIARPENIAKFTDGRHNPADSLNVAAAPLSGPPHPERRAPPVAEPCDPAKPTILLIHEDDLSPGFAADSAPVIGHAAILACDGRSPGTASEKVEAFVTGGVEDAASRLGERFGTSGPTTDDVDHLADWIVTSRAAQVITPYAPVGPVASKLRRLTKALSARDVPVIRVIRPWDSAAWPHSTHGFFRFKKKIPELLGELTASVEEG